MAGSLKPNVDGLGAEAKATLLGGSLTAGTPNGLLDGIQGNYNSNTAYWYNSNNYIEISFDTPVNIWRMSDVSYPMHIGALKIERFEENQWVEKTFEQTLESSPTQWSKWISNVPSGRYKFSSTGTPRMDGEWFLESISSPILQFNKMLSDNIPNINSDLTKTNFYLSDDNMLYIEHNDNIIKPIYEKKEQEETILFDGAFNNGSVVLADDINNYDFLTIRADGGTLANQIPSLTSGADKGYYVYGYPVYGEGYEAWRLFQEYPTHWTTRDKIFPASGYITFPEPLTLTTIKIRTSRYLRNWNITLTKITGEQITVASGSSGSMTGTYDVPRDKYTRCDIYISGTSDNLRAVIWEWGLYLTSERTVLNKILTKQNFNKKIKLLGEGLIYFNSNNMFLEQMNFDGTFKIIGVKKAR